MNCRSFSETVFLTQVLLVDMTTWKTLDLRNGLLASQFSFLVSWRWVRRSQLGSSATIWSARDDDDDDERGAVGGMNGRRNRSSLSKPSPVPLCSLWMPHNLTSARTGAFTVETRRLTDWATARSCLPVRIWQLIGFHTEILEIYYYYYYYVHCAVSVIGVLLLTRHINNKELNWIELFSPSVFESVWWQSEIS
jgi:hypothetical protein